MAAEHWGNCQICGREHKVSGSTIAKHGYTLRHGWQEGACYGSGGKPIQISCDLIEGAIESAKRYIDQSEQEIARLTKTPLNDDGTITMLVRKTTRTGTLIYPARVKVSLNDKGEPVAIGTDGKTIKTWPRYSGIKTTGEAEKELANKWIGYLSHTIEESRESIVYLTERVKNWKPSELRPITEMERAAAGPKRHMQAKKWGYTTTLCASSATGAQRMVSAAFTTKREEVTCAACLKALKEQDERPARIAAEKEKERLADIRWYEREIKDLQKQLKKFADDPVATINLTQSLTAYTAKLEELKAAAPKE